jgi:hypothetical protein
MRPALSLLALWAVSISAGASAQPAKECEILKRALYGDKIIDGAAFLVGPKVPADLLWPVPGAQATTAVGKGDYFFSFQFSDAAGNARADALFAALDQQVARCLPSARRGQRVPTIHAYCPSDSRKIASVIKSASNRFVEVSLGVNTVTNRAEACR